MPRDDMLHAHPTLWGRLKPYLAVFLVTAVVTYTWVASRSRPPEVERGGAAHAQIVIEPVVAVPNAETLRSQIANEESIARALTRSDPRWATSDTIKRIRYGLRVTTQRGERPKSVAVGLILADADRAFATSVINLLGERYAEGCRVRLRQEMRWNHLAATEALDEARQKVHRAQVDLDSFLERHFSEEERLAQRALTARQTAAATPQPVTLPQPAAPPPQAAVVVRPNLVDNPDWLRIEEQIQTRRRALFELLAVRTPLHPDVQAMQTDIADLERRLMSTPRQLIRPIDEPPTAPARTAPATATAPELVAPPATAAVVLDVPAEQQLEAARTFATLQASLRRAIDEETRLSEAERVAWQRQYCVPNVKFTPAGEPVLTSATASSAGSHVLWVTLLAAMAVASGVGMIVNRPAAEPRVSSVDEAEQACGVPVLGIVRVADLPDEPAADAQASPRKLLWMLGGVACIVGALALVLSRA